MGPFNEALEEFDKAFDQQIDEHKQELQLQKTIPVLSIIEDETSVAVRNQYEENPYPRWVNTSIEPIPYKIPHFLTRTKLLGLSNYEHFSDKPKILVAGCGTGQNAIASASCFKDSQVTAIDLSLSSLGYAKRKTKSLDCKTYKVSAGR